MKKTIVLLLLLLPMTVCAQTESFKSYFSKCTGRDGYQTIELPGKTILMLSGTEKSSNAITLIKTLYSVICEDFTDSDLAEARKMIDKGGYELTSSMNDSGNEVRIYQTKDGNGDNEFLMLTTDDDMVIASIIGDIDIKEVLSLTK